MANELVKIHNYVNNWLLLLNIRNLGAKLIIDTFMMFDLSINNVKTVDSWITAWFAGLKTFFVPRCDR